MPEPLVPVVLASGFPCRGHRDRGGREACRHLDSPALNLQKAKSVATPGVKSTTSDVGPTLPLDRHTPFRSINMRTV